MREELLILISVILGALFFWFIITPPSFINFIPQALHESFFRNIIKEGTFIIVFDLLISCGVAYFLFRILKRLFTVV
jgi:hypothetical protein